MEHKDDRMEMEVRLWAYIDGLLDAGAREDVARLVNTDATWRHAYDELLATHQLLQSAELEQPSMRFTRNVMDEISRLQIAPAMRSYINKKIIWGIAGFFITVIVSFLIYGISQVDWSAGSATGGIDLSRVNLSGIFNNTYVNLFMMANAVLGLMLLDRYLSFRRRQWGR